MKRKNLKQVIIVVLLLCAVVTGGFLIVMRWPTSCLRYQTTPTAAPTK